MNNALPLPRENVAALPAYSRAPALRVRWRAASNESPLGPGPSVVRAIRDACESPHLYPTLTGDLLVDALACAVDLPSDQILVGGGSLALLQQALTTYAGPGDEVVFAWRSYEAYPIVVGVTGATAVTVPLDDEARHDVDRMLAAATSRTRAVIICNPNNPTGTALSPSELERLVAGLPSRVLVLLDEAYREFDGEAVDTIPWLSRFPNLVILRTFSKAYGLAGLRAGYALASPAVIQAIAKVAPPFGLNRVAESAATAALSDVDHLDHIVRLVQSARARLRVRLLELGLATPVSASNFLWLPFGDQSEALARDCLTSGLAVRAFPGEGVRFTVGCEDAERVFVPAVNAHRSLSPTAPRTTGSQTAQPATKPAGGP